MHFCEIVDHLRAHGVLIQTGGSADCEETAKSRRDEQMAAAYIEMEAENARLRASDLRLATKINAMSHAGNRVTAQRDSLIRAMRKIVDLLETDCPNFAMDAATAALAEIEGKK